MTSSQTPRNIARLLGIGPFAAVVLTVALSGAGCPGTLENKDQFLTSGGGGTGGGGGCGDMPAFLQQRCGSSNCHDADMPIAGLDLTDDEGLVARIKDVDGLGSGCTTAKLADSANPAESLIYTKCVAPTCGSKMPIGGTALTQTDFDCILGWLESI